MTMVKTVTSKLPKIKYEKLEKARSTREVEIINRHSLKMGRVLWEWNHLHSQLLGVFCVMLPGNSIGDASEIWHSFGADSAQRKMLLEMSKTHFWDNKKAYERLKWIMQAIQDLSAYRNIAAHLPMEIGDSQGPDDLLMPQSMTVKRVNALRIIFASLDRNMFWEDISTDLFLLVQYVRHFMAYLIHADARPPLPRKPKLQSLLKVKKVELQIQKIAKTPIWHGRRPALRKKLAAMQNGEAS